jgi:hypothetical protein
VEDVRTGPSQHLAGDAEDHLGDTEQQPPADAVGGFGGERSHLGEVDPSADHS